MSRKLRWQTASGAFFMERKTGSRNGHRSGLKKGGSDGNHDNFKPADFNVTGL
jgi:hypothetical protein